MNNTVWEEFIGRLYSAFHNTTEVMALVGYRISDDNATEDIVEYVEYYTSNDESEVVGNFREIVKSMSKYNMLRQGKARFLLVHNHPGGTAEPSVSDKVLADRFLVATRMIGAKSMGSYIFIDGGELVLVGSKEEDFVTERMRISNQYPTNGTISIARMGVRAQFDRITRGLFQQTTNGVTISEEALDEFTSGQMATLREGVEPYWLVLLDTQNRVTGILPINKLHPNISRQSLVNEQVCEKGLSAIFLLDSQRLAVYDKRNNVERDGRGLAEDTKSFINAMGVSGFPINFYVN